MQLTTHISLTEATKSNTAERLGIDNFPNSYILSKMQETATQLFEPLRIFVGEPIYISSFYRSPELNKVIGGSSRSQHCKGEAIDIDDVYSNRYTNADYFNYIKENLPFDQLIWEFGDDESPSWVHMSYTEDLKERRGRILRAIKEKGKTIYKDITNV